MTAALLWGLWRRGRWHLILLLGGLALFAALLLSIIPAAETAHRAALGTALLWIAVVGLAIDLLHLAEGEHGAGFDTRLFVLPVSCRRLAATWLAALVGVIAILYLAAALTFRLWLGIPGPHLGTTLFIAAAMAWLVCLLWVTPRRPRRRMLFSLLLPVLFIAPLLPTLPDLPPGPPFAALEQLGIAGLLLLTLYLAGAFAFGTWAIARHRHGDARAAKRRRVGRHQESRHQESVAAPTAAAPFHHSFSALLWLDWKEKGHLIPALAGIPWLLLLAVGLSGLRSRDEIAAFATALLGAAAFFGPVLVAGIVCRLQEGKIGARLDDLRTLRPVSSTRLAAVYLAHGLLGLSLAWGLTAAGAVATFTLFGTGGGPAHTIATVIAHTPTSKLVFHLLLGVLALAVAGWLQIGALSALFLTGRNTAVGLLILLPYTVGGALLAFRDAVTRLPFATLLPAAPWLLGGASLLGTLAILALAHRKGLLRPWPLAWQASALVALLAALAAHFPIPADGRAFALLGMAIATLAPWPATSLALRWNRHR